MWLEEDNGTEAQTVGNESDFNTGKNPKLNWTELNYFDV